MEKGPAQAAAGEASRDSCTPEPPLGSSRALGFGLWPVQPTSSLPAPPSLWTTGISGKSQVLFAVVFTARYLDLFTNYISLYNTCMKVSLWPSCWAFLRRGARGGSEGGENVGPRLLSPREEATGG